jgi:hypothetical protein
MDIIVVNAVLPDELVLNIGGCNCNGDGCNDDTGCSNDAGCGQDC